jgi:hypothetical protein
MNEAPDSSCERKRKQMSNQQQAERALREAALKAFTEYFVRNYPGPDTIICRPEWHAPKIFRAAEVAIEKARLAVAPVGEPQSLTADELRSCIWTFAHGEINLDVTVKRINNFLRKKCQAASAPVGASIPADSAGTPSDGAEGREA